MLGYHTRLRNIREDADLTQSEIGALLNKSQQGYNHIEACRAELKIDDLVKICKFYNLSAEYIIGLTDERKPYKQPCFYSEREAWFSFVSLVYRKGLVCNFALA